MTNKTKKIVNKEILTLARKCRIRYSDLVELYDNLRALHIFPRKCLRIMKVIYKYQIEDYDKMMSEETI